MRAAGEALLSLLYPQRVGCHACGAPLMVAESLLCDACERSLAACAFAPGRAETVLEATLAFAASPYRYDGAAAALVRGLKFGADFTAALPLAEGMAAAYARYLPLRAGWLCVPVPSHYRRVRRRGYNQAAVLADALAALTGLGVSADALLRTHHVRSQVGQGRAVRQKNVRDAFVVNPAACRLLRGKAVLLVDDVLTTGATAAECARVLLAGGAASVALLTACRA